MSPVPSGTPCSPPCSGSTPSLCRRHSGQEDLVLGVPLANRPSEFERTVGMMISTLPVRLRVSPQAPASDLARQAMTRVFEAVEHEAAPIQEIVKAVGRSGRGLDNPLFNLAFGMHDRQFPDAEIPGVSMDLVVGPSTASARFDLTVVVLPASVRRADTADESLPHVLGLVLPALRSRRRRVCSPPVSRPCCAPTSTTRRHRPASLDMTVTEPLVLESVTEGREREVPQPVPPAVPVPVAPAADGDVARWVEAFQDVLESDDVDADTDFFNAGGYSLLVPQPARPLPAGSPAGALRRACSSRRPPQPS
ncbi:condensation domain-containing protein [Nocardioides convexus]|uniref:condensation domain-containing protein n=1 Tax=Nocardioides convexus TaxID=2712224 RepID=UPI002418665D|nr:condensation domain-containing protein [Nocardioides convexus]